MLLAKSVDVEFDEIKEAVSVVPAETSATEVCRVVCAVPIMVAVAADVGSKASDAISVLTSATEVATALITSAAVDAALSAVSTALVRSVVTVSAEDRSTLPVEVARFVTCSATDVATVVAAT